MENVSFEVAKALKKAGYPQAKNDIYYNKNGAVRYCRPHAFTVTYACPTYLETWLWLWREKKIDVTPYNCPNGDWVSFDITSTDPEEAIIAAIEYLVDNDLIK